MKTNRTSTRRGAFTLVELLVVLGIVSLLAALLFAAFHAIRENGRRTTCLSNQKQILLAMQLYQEDTAGHFPLRDPLDIHSVIWIDALLTYGKEPSVFICPSDLEIENIRTFGFHTNVDDGSKHPSIPTSYVVSEELLWNRAHGKIEPRSVSEVARPASTIFLCDGAKAAFPHPPYWTDRNVGNPATTMGALGYILRDPLSSHEPSSYSENFAPNPRHNGRVNVSFVDGHVESTNTSQWYFPDTPYLDPARGG